MNEEIKEILNRLNYVKKEPNKLSYYPEDLLTRRDMWLLLDYITNLQQELQKANDTLDTHNELIEKLQQDLDKANDIIKKDRQFYKCRMDEYVRLKEENEFLKLNNPEMNIEHFRIVKENKRKIDNLRKENERIKENNQLYQEEMARTWKIADDYKSRTDKAIEYIEDKNNLILNQQRRKLINILKGD